MKGENSCDVMVMVNMQLIMWTQTHLLNINDLIHEQKVIIFLMHNHVWIYMYNVQKYWFHDIR